MSLFSDTDYRTLYGSQFSGSYGSFGVKVLIAGHKLDTIDLNSAAIWGVAHDAVENVTNALMEAVIAADPVAQQRRVAERAQLLGLFRHHPIYVEEIPNGYDPNSAYLKHLPWFIVTTRVGRIKIGWRRRVIQIEWTDTRGTLTSGALFAAEDVTKEERLIHAWTVEKAQAYIDLIIGSASTSLSP